jgi:hypothetical protein
MRIAELVESFDLPETQVAERAWADARRRVRRRRGALAGAAASVAVAGVVGTTLLGGAHRDTQPTPGPEPTHTPTRTPTQTAEPSKAPLVQELWRHGRWRSELADMYYLPGSAGPPSLSADPVGRAVLAINDPGDKSRVLVYGEDSHWRQVDVPGLVAPEHAPGYFDPVLRPTSLSPDATQLALPQPHELVVVDLETGTSRRFPVGTRFNVGVTWADASHVLVSGATNQAGGARRSSLVDLTDGSVHTSAYKPWTAFLGDTTLTWRAGPLRWSDGRVVQTIANNDGRGFAAPPQVRDGVVVGVMGVIQGGEGLPPATWGIVAVDGDTGKVLAYLPVSHQKLTDSLVLGWDGDRPLIGLPQPGVVNLDVFAWDWRRGELDPVGSVGARDVSWGTGQLTP